jgi:glycosyltransferase involved in cell wall biosynthesis
MPLKMKNAQIPAQQQQSAPQQNQSPYIHYQPVQLGNVGMPLGQVLGTPTQRYGVAHNIQGSTPAMPAMPGQGLKRAINYYADYGGCGWWRMIQPEIMLNAFQKGIINGVTTMIIDPRFYLGISAVRLQRQATPQQLQFVQFLKQGSEQVGFKVIYEIDDIIFVDDIPKFNRCRMAFEDPQILQSSLQMMQMCDEISVTCQYMKEYYESKTGNKRITVIPNYPSRMWFDGHYNESVLSKNYDKNKKRPRILYAGSGTHIDVMNRTNQHDDFTHVVQQIIKTRKEFKWVFVGGFPLPCKPFIDVGEMEFIQWYPLLELPKAYTETNAQCCIAPLVDCTFNKAKSNIKFLESACCGLPGAFQDLITYKDAPHKFKTGDEMIDNIKLILKDQDFYMKQCRNARKYAETMWLDDHLDEFKELYYTKWDEERKALSRLNPR